MSGCDALLHPACVSVSCQDQSIVAPASALLQLAMFLWHTGSLERARACAERALEQAPGDAASLSLLGWILIHHPHAGADPGSIEPEDLEQAAGLFEQVWLKQPRHTEVTCCCCSCMTQCCRVSPTPSTPPPSRNLNTIIHALLLMQKATHLL